MKLGLSLLALRHALAISVLAFTALLVGCGPAMEEAPPARAPIIGRYPMRPLITDPHVARMIGRRTMAEIGYDEIIRLAVQKEWLRYREEKPNTDHVLVQAAPPAGFWPIFTPWAVTAGVTSQADSPAPGPADLVALGILVLGLIDAGLLDGAILTSVDAIEAVRRRPKPTLNRCLDAAAGGKYLWEELCRAMTNKFDARECWEKAELSEQVKRNWCFNRFGN
jgi:hypothetical protein